MRSSLRLTPFRETSSSSRTPHFWSLTFNRDTRVSSDRYAWIVQSNTTLGTLMATIGSSIALNAPPEIRGVHLAPLKLVAARREGPYVKEALDARGLIVTTH